MQAKYATLTRLCLAWMLSLHLVGCAVTDLTPEPEEGQDWQQLAEQQQSQGDHLGAAQTYEQLARNAGDADRLEYSLRAAESYVAARRLPQARAQLANLPASKDDDIAIRIQIIKAEIALGEDQPTMALSALASAGDKIPKPLRARAHMIRATAHEQNGDLLEAARERCLLDPLLDDANATRDNHMAILTLVSSLPDATLMQSRGVQPETLAGWMQLALINKSARGNPDEFRSGLQVWLDDHKKHPASGDVLNQLLEQRPTLSHGYPAQIGLLLPLNGRYTNEAQAIRNGFITAYYANRFGGNPPLLRIYDTGEGVDTVRRQYDQAIKDGVGLVIGPLTKQAATALARSGPLGVPVLALNYLEDDAAAPEYFFQFGLSPEDEARQVAERASLDGRTRAIALAMQGDWGNRMITSFKQRFEELGGQVMEYQTFPANTAQLGTQLRQLLRADGSGARRQDVDFLFLAVLPDQARGIRPQLQYLQAGDLPIYATSQVFTGTRTTSPELDGMLFCDMPWLLNPQLTFSSERQRVSQLWPQSLASHQRLYALGIDAYNVIPYLAQLRGSQTQGYNGATGRLFVDAEGRLHRQLLWGQFSGGRATLASDPIAAPPPR